MPTSTERIGVPGGRARFRAISLAVVPESSSLNEDAWREAETIVVRALNARPATVRRQLGLFLRLLDGWSIVRHGRPFRGLSVAERFALLDALSRSRLLLLRRGVWGIRTLALMGFYARPEAARSIGYRASAAGWDARRSTLEAGPS